MTTSAKRLKWIKYIPHKPTPKQLQALMSDSKELLFGGALGGGKQLQLNEKLLFSRNNLPINGKAKDVRVGDYLYGSNGSPVKVIGKSAEEIHPCYRITFDDSSSLVVSADHKWTVFDLSKRAKGDKERGNYQCTVNTEWLASKNLKYRTQNRFAIPLISAPIEHFNPISPKVNPYLLGYWLGNGCVQGSTLTCHSDDADEILDNIEKFTGVRYETKIYDDTAKRSKILIPGFRAALKKVGYIAKRNYAASGTYRTFNKSAMPFDWELWSIRDRELLLAGLLDADGHANNHGSLEFGSVIPEITDLVRGLLHSLGQKPTRVYPKPPRKDDWKTMYMTTCYVTRNVFRLKRKAARLRLNNHPKKLSRRYITEIKYIGTRKGVCFAVDSPDKLYVAGKDYILTHNSDFLLMSCLQYLDVPGYASGIFRKQLTDLKQPGALLDRAKEWLDPWKKHGVKYVPGEHTYYFPTTMPDGSKGADAKLVFCYVGDVNAKDRYQSSEYQTIAFDEISQWETPSDYEFMTTRLRRTTCKTHGKKKDGSPNWTRGCPECELKKTIPVRIRAACVDFGNVLTRSGWKPIEKVTIGEQVLSVNSDGVAEWKPVLDVYHCPHEGNLVRIQKKNLFCSFTEDHRVTYCTQKEKFKIIPWDQHTGKSIKLARAAIRPSIVKKPFHIPCKINREVFIKFLGLYLGDGSIGHNPRKGNYKVIITQLSDNVPLIEDVLSQLGLRYNRSNNGDYQITNKELWEYLRPLGYAKDKHVPRKVMESLSGEESEILLSHLLATDGSQRINSNTFGSTSKRLRDDVMALAVMFGYKVQTTSVDDGHPKHNRKYVVYLTRNDLPATLVDKNPGVRSDVTTIKHSGMVYCIKVKDNENFFVEQRGYVWVSGNTNPGGLGGNWIKKRFQIIPDPKVYPDRRDAIAAATAGIRVPFIGTHPQREFVPSYIDDNPHLDLADYSEFLDNLEPELKAQLKDGNWEARADSRFKRNWVRYFEIHPFGLRLGPQMFPFSHFQKIFATIDYASTAKEGIIDNQVHRKAPSFSVMCVWGETKEKDLFLLDCWRDRCEVPVIVEEAVKVWARWQEWGIKYLKSETNGVGSGPTQYLQRLGIPIKKVVKGSDKLENSTSAMLLMKGGKVYFPINAPFIYDVEDEVFSWIGLPAETDDIIDNLSDAANELGAVADALANKAEANQIKSTFLHVPTIRNKSPQLSIGTRKRHPLLPRKT